MGKIITIKDKNFKLNIENSTILERIHKLSAQINNDYKDDPNNLILLGILNGSYMFMSELTSNIDIMCNISFTKVSSYNKTVSTGNIKDLIGINEDLEGKDVCIVEDIVDTGITMNYILTILKSFKKVKSIKIATLFNKHLNHDIELDYVGFNIPNDFIVGFGLDYDGFGRNLKDIYILNE